MIQGVLGWSWDQVENLTLRRLLVSYDAKLLTSWDHTSVLSALIHNLTITVANIASKKKHKPKDNTHFHPYREQVKKKPFNPNNVMDLQLIARRIHAQSQR